MDSPKPLFLLGSWAGTFLIEPYRFISLIFTLGIDMRSVSCLAVLCWIGLVNVGVAQPPWNDGDRWSGFTAITPAQGYGQGSPLTLTWGIVPDGTSINDSAFSGFANANSNLKARLNTIYGNQGVWQPLFQSVFDRWSSISGLSYQFEANDDGQAYIVNGNQTPLGVLGVRPDIRIGGKALDGNSGVLAYNFFPEFGDMVIDTNDTFFNTTSSGSLRLRNVVAHEHGHGLGMDHMNSNNSAQLMEPFFDSSFDGPQYHDILAAHRYYGDVNEKSFAGLGNDVSTRATALGNVGIGISIGNDARNLVVASTEVDFVSIDDTSDTDFYSFTVASQGNINIFLEALGVTYGATGDPGAGNTPFNTAQRSNLALTLFGTNGTTILQTINANGLGGNETINFNLGAAGTYFVRVTGTDNADASSLDTQFYGLTLDYIAVPEPGSLALSALGGLLAVFSRRRSR